MIANIFNLGPIRKVSIDLRKPFTLFCGPNNTGKTYLSYILYALHKDTGYVNPKGLSKLAQRLYKEREIELCKDDFDKYVHDIAQQLKSALGSIFGIGDKAVEKLFSTFKIELSLSDEEFSKIIEMPSKQEANNKFFSLHLEKEEGRNRVTYRISGDTDGSDSNIQSILNILLCRMMTNLCLGNLGRARMLTVERNSIYTFKTELSIGRNELIERIQQQAKGKDLDIVDLISRSSRRYPLAIRDSLRIANDLENVQKHDGDSVYKGIAEQIENGILNGKVKITRNGDVEFVSNNMAQSKQLPIHLSSSIVKTMSSLIIYLKHIAQKGDLLIIDEPEMNFHPDVQIQLMKIFAIMAKSGLRLIVSTHSDYMVREVNNLIMAHNVYAKASHVVADFQYTEEMLLDKNDVSAKFFCYSGRKKSLDVQDIPIDEDGFMVKSIDNAIVNQNEVTETLYDLLTRDDVHE